MDSEAKILAYAVGGMLSGGAAVGIGYVLGGPVAALTVAGAVGGILLWLSSRSRLKTPPVARQRQTYEILDGETPTEAFKRINEGR